MSWGSGDRATANALKETILPGHRRKQTRSRFYFSQGLWASLGILLSLPSPCPPQNLAPEGPGAYLRPKDWISFSAKSAIWGLFVPIRQKDMPAAAEPGTAGLEMEISFPSRRPPVPAGVPEGRVGARARPAGPSELGKARVMP